MYDEHTEKYINQIILKLKSNEREAAWVVFQDSMRVLSPPNRQTLIEALVRYVEQYETAVTPTDGSVKVASSFAPQGLTEKPEIGMHRHMASQMNGAF